MNLTPREKDKLLVSLAAMVARGRLERGVKLNHPEAIALITDFVVEGARDGKSVAELMEAGAHVITADQCMDGIAAMIHDVQVESLELNEPQLLVRNLPQFLRLKVREKLGDRGRHEIRPLLKPVTKHIANRRPLIQPEDAPRDHLDQEENRHHPHRETNSQRDPWTMLVLQQAVRHVSR